MEKCLRPLYFIPYANLILSPKFDNNINNIMLSATLCYKHIYCGHFVVSEKKKSKNTTFEPENFCNCSVHGRSKLVLSLNMRYLGRRNDICV